MRNQVLSLLLSLFVLQIINQHSFALNRKFFFSFMYKFALNDSHNTLFILIQRLIVMNTKYLKTYLKIIPPRLDRLKIGMIH